MDLNSLRVPCAVDDTTVADLMTACPNPAWKLMPGAVERLVAHFNLTRPVIVLPVTECKYTRIFGEFFGCYTACVGYDNKLVHAVSVNALVHPYVADEFLWHEFCHAGQAERLAAPDFGLEGIAALHAKYHMESFLRSYAGNTYEIEARNAQKLAPSNPLTLSTAAAPSFKVPLSVLAEAVRVPTILVDPTM